MRRGAGIPGVLLTMLVLSAAAHKPPSGQSTRPKQTSIDVTGQWAMTIVMDVGTGTPILQLEQEGQKLTGTYSGNYGDVPITGAIQGQDIRFTFTMGADRPMKMTFVGKIASDGRSMKGTADMAQMGNATWEAKKRKARWLP